MEKREKLKVSQRIKKFVTTPRTTTFRRGNVGFIQSLQPAPALTREQAMLNDLFGGNISIGTGENLPRVDNHNLMKLTDDGEEYSETGELFGFGR